MAQPKIFAIAAQRRPLPTEVCARRLAAWDGGGAALANVLRMRVQ